MTNPYTPTPAADKPPPRRPKLLRLFLEACLAIIVSAGICYFFLFGEITPVPVEVVEE